MRLMFAVLVSLCAASAAIGFAFPAVAAVACPYCYGFASVGSNIYVQSDANTLKRTSVISTLAEARGRVRGFYGTLTSAPHIFVCQTAACYSRFGGKSRGVALLDQALFLSQGGTDIVVAAHELAHIELHHRIGAAKTLMKAIPQWFDEGLAVNVSDDPRYLKPKGTPDRCFLEPEGLMPTDRVAWIENAASHNLYARAACKVSRWLNTHGGPNAVVRLADEIAAGSNFADASR